MDPDKLKHTLLTDHTHGLRMISHLGSKSQGLWLMPRQSPDVRVNINLCFLPGSFHQFPQDVSVSVLLGVFNHIMIPTERWSGGGIKQGSQVFTVLVRAITWGEKHTEKKPSLWVASVP